MEDLSAPKGSFSKIVTITVAERDALYDIAESFDEVARIATTYHQLPGERVGSAAELQDWVAASRLRRCAGWTSSNPASHRAGSACISRHPPTRR